MPMNMRRAGNKSSTASQMAKCLRWPVPLRRGWWMLWELYQFNHFPLTTSRLLSSLYTNTLPNQITFGFWALISEYLISIVMVTQGSGSHPEPLLLTCASRLAIATKDANWLVRMDTWLGALGQAHIPLHQAGWAQLVCGLTTGHSTKDSPAVLKESHGISFLPK